MGRLLAIASESLNILIPYFFYIPVKIAGPEPQPVDGH
jgi:hypothetical protein